MFKIFKIEMENQLIKKIKILRNDRGGEYESPFGEFCVEHEIIHQTIVPYSPQSNDIAKRKNCTLKKIVPQNLWEKSIMTANYLLNKLRVMKRKEFFL